MYKIDIMDRDSCTEFSIKDLKEDCIIISINDTFEETTIHENKHIIDIKRLYFDDIEEDIPTYLFFSMNQALEIKDFVDRYKDKVNHIVVHCTAGISRSGAIGCVLARYLNGNDDYLLLTGRYIPNKHVYKTMSKVLNLEYSEKLFKRKRNLRNKGNRRNLNGYGNYGVYIDDMFDIELK
jgi:predicted protein tyrosine phosphatase